MTEWLYSCMHFFAFFLIIFLLDCLNCASKKPNCRVRYDETRRSNWKEHFRRWTHSCIFVVRRNSVEIWKRERKNSKPMWYARKYCGSDRKNTLDPFTRTWNDWSRKLYLAKRLWIRWNSTRNLLHCGPNWRNKRCSQAQGTCQSVEFTTRGRSERLEWATHAGSRQYAGHLRERIGSPLKEKVEQSRHQGEPGERRREWRSHCRLVEVRKAHEKGETTAPGRHLTSYPRSYQKKKLTRMRQ